MCLTNNIKDSSVTLPQVAHGEFEGVRCVLKDAPTASFLWPRLSSVNGVPAKPHSEQRWKMASRTRLGKVSMFLMEVALPPTMRSDFGQVSFQALTRPLDSSPHFIKLATHMGTVVALRS